MRAQRPIELDVHLLSDGEVVVFHDDDLLRLTGDKRLTTKVKSSDLRELRLFGTDEKIPLMEDVLRLVDGKVPLLIEIKCLEHNGKLESALMKILNGYEGEYALQSFNPLTLAWIKKHHPRVRRGLLSGGLEDEGLSPAKKFALKNLLSLPVVAPDFIGYEWSFLESSAANFVRNSTRIPLIAWTVRSEEIYRRCHDLCHNIIFEGFVPEEVRFAPDSKEKNL
jgi:glycerophosphoryl diester phosphodiesterase